MVLSYGVDIQKSVLEGCCNWYPDTPGKADVCGATNAGYVKRKGIWKKSAKVPFCIPLQMDALETDRFFPSGLDFHFRLTKAPDDLLYTTAGTDKYKIEFSQLKCHARRITMTKALIADHTAKFRANQNAVYPFTRTDIKTINIPTGVSNAWSDNIYRSRIPNSCLIIFIDSAALAGTPKKNVLNFQNFNITRVKCLINSEEIPAGGYRQDYSADDFALTLRRFFDNTGVRTNNIGSGLTPEMFKDGHNIYAFDFSPDQCNGFHDHIDVAGKVEFEVAFKAPTNKSITMVMFSQYDDQLILDGARNVINRGQPMAIQ